MEEPIILKYIEHPKHHQGSRGKLHSNKPMLEIPISEKRRIDCLIDSGADKSISFKNIGMAWFNLEFNEKDRVPNQISGFNVCPMEECQQHPNKAPQYTKSITFKIKNKEIVLNVIWIDRGQNLNEDTLFVLGRDFFEYFDILFKQREEQVWLYPK